MTGCAGKFGYKASGSQFRNNLRRCKPEFRIAAFGERPAVAVRIACVNEVVNTNSCRRNVFEKTSHDDVFTAANGNEPLCAGTLICEVTPRSDEDAVRNKYSSDVREKIPDGLKRRKMREGIAHADDDSGGSRCDEIGKIKDVSVVGMDAESGIVPTVAFQFGEQLCTGVDRMDWPEAKLSERKGLKPGSGTQVDREAA